MSEERHFSIPWQAVIALAFLCFIAGARIEMGAAHHEIERDAILHHAAHYITNAEGEPVFTWNTPISP